MIHLPDPKRGTNRKDAIKQLMTPDEQFDATEQILHWQGRKIAELRRTVECQQREIEVLRQMLERKQIQMTEVITAAILNVERGEPTLKFCEALRKAGDQ